MTLLGDAAHPMLPFRGQGAAQSIEDGFVLERRLAADSPTLSGQRGVRPAPPGAYGRAAICLEGGGNLHLTESTGVAARHARMLEPPDAQVGGFDWVWGTTWNAQSPIARRDAVVHF